MWTQYLLQKPKDILNQLPFYFSYLTCDSHLPSSPTMVWSIQLSWIAHRGFSARSKVGRGPHRNVIGILYLIVNLSQTAWRQRLTYITSHTSPDTSSGEADPRFHFQSALQLEKHAKFDWSLVIGSISQQHFTVWTNKTQSKFGCMFRVIVLLYYPLYVWQMRWFALDYELFFSTFHHTETIWHVCPQQLVSILCRRKALAYLVFVFFRRFLLTFWNYAGVIGTLKGVLVLWDRRSN